MITAVQLSRVVTPKVRFGEKELVMQNPSAVLAGLPHLKILFDWVKQHSDVYVADHEANQLGSFMDGKDRSNPYLLVYVGRHPIQKWYELDSDGGLYQFRPNGIGERQRITDMPQSDFEALRTLLLTVLDSKAYLHNGQQDTDWLKFPGVNPT